MLLVRGRSDSSDLEHLSSQTHTAVCALQVWIFWEPRESVCRVSWRVPPVDNDAQILGVTQPCHRREEDRPAWKSQKKKEFQRACSSYRRTVLNAVMCRFLQAWVRMYHCGYVPWVRARGYHACFMLGAVALELMRCVSCKGKFSREICGSPPTCKVCRTWQRILNVLTSTQFPLQREREALHILYTAIGQLDDLAAQEYQSKHMEGSAQARTERSQSEELEEEETEQVDSASESILRDRSPLPRRQIERKARKQRQTAGSQEVQR